MLTRRNVLIAAGTMAASPALSQGGEPIRLGVILPLSGTSSLAGFEVRNGMTLALDEINGDGGALGRRLEFIFEDDESVPSRGVTAVRKLIERDRVAGLLGPYNSAVALPVAEVARAARVPIVSGGSTAASVTNANTPGDPWFFRAFPDSVEQASSSVEAVAKRLNLKRIAIVYENTPYGRSLTESFEQLSPRFGLEVVAKEMYAQGEQDFQSMLARLRTLRPDGVYMAGLIAEGASILRQAADVGLRTRFIGSGGMISDKLIELAQGAAEGLALSTAFEPTTPNPLGRQFAERYRARFRENANFHGSLGYDGARVLVNGVRRANTLDGLAIRNAIVAASDFPLASGPAGTTARFNDRGGVFFELFTSVVRNGVREIM